MTKEKSEKNPKKREIKRDSKGRFMQSGDKPKKKRRVQNPRALQTALNGKRKGGKLPRVLTDREILIMQALAVVHNKEKTAELLGMTLSTLNDIMKRQPDVATAYREAEMNFVSIVSSTMKKKILNGDTKMLIWFLDNQCGFYEKRAEATAKATAKAQEEFKQDNGENDEWEIIEIG